MYRLVASKTFDKSFRKLDKVTRDRVAEWIAARLVDCENPRLWGKALTGNMKGRWRYRIGDCRLLAEIRDKELVIIAVEIDHRSAIYRRR